MAGVLWCVFHNLHTTIPDVSVLHNHHCIPASPIHGSSLFGGGWRSSTPVIEWFEYHPSESCFSLQCGSTWIAKFSEHMENNSDGIKMLHSPTVTFEEFQNANYERFCRDYCKL